MLSSPDGFDGPMWLKNLQRLLDGMVLMCQSQWQADSMLTAPAKGATASYPIMYDVIFLRWDYLLHGRIVRQGIQCICHVVWRVVCHVVWRIVWRVVWHIEHILPLLVKPTVSFFFNRLLMEIQLYTWYIGSDNHSVRDVATAREFCWTIAEEGPALP